MTPSKDKPQYWDGDVPWVTPKDMKRPVLADSQDHVSAQALEETGLKLHAPEGVMVVTRGMILAHTFPVARNAVPVTVNQDMKVLRPGQETDARYLAWLLQGLSSVMLSLTDESAHGTKALRTDQWENLPVPVPRDRGLQERIADFLDEQTARIDALIAEKERLQATLDEWRAAELTRICFGGAAAVEDTGNAWIPKLPNGWRLVRLKHLVAGIEQGWSPECEARLAEDGEWGVLKAGASNGGVFRDTEHKALPAHFEPIPALEVRPGDVIVTRASGSADLVGSFAYVYSTRSQLMLSDKNFRLKFSAAPHLLPELLAWMCSTPALREQVRQYVSGAEGLAKNIGSGNLRELWLAVPPAAAQAGIVKTLHAAAKRLRLLQEHLVRHIERLREYRSSLISAAVTGQLNFEDFVARKAA
jgi:type I restriction enzyme S subunit